MSSVQAQRSYPVAVETLTAAWYELVQILSYCSCLIFLDVDLGDGTSLGSVDRHINLAAC